MTYPKLIIVGGLLFLGTLVVTVLAGSALTSETPMAATALPDDVPLRAEEPAWWERIDVHKAEPDAGQEVTTYSIPDEILFSVDSSTVDSDGIRRLEELARTELADAVTIMVTGHTDGTGTTEHNLELSEKRAEAVKTVLLEAGLSAGIIDTSGQGQCCPVADESSGDVEAARAENRRTELTVTRPAPEE